MCKYNNVTETVHHTLSMCVPIISMGALGA